LKDFVNSHGFSWEYFVFGQGQEVLFAFHGFDNDASDFSIFEKSFGNRYKIVAVNLFFHGNSKTPRQKGEDPLNAEILADLFNQLLFRLNCSRFSMLGFSLGGRVILQLLPHFAGRIDRILLLAPDGLKISLWYRFITGSLVGKMLFRRVVERAGIFLMLSKIFYKLNLVGEKQYLFALSNFDTLEKRKKVYAVWMIFRNIIPDAVDAGKAIRKFAIPVDIYFGKRDTIIPASFGKYFIRKSSSKVNIHLLDAGHNLMKEKVVEELEPWLKA
jgi:pimeloyl-ACP methyl ester carboxylesterase